MKLQVVKILNKLYSLMIPYSTQETKIGKWIDGKNLYRIVLTGTKVSGTNLEISLPPNANVVAYYGTLVTANNFKFALDRYESSAIFHRSAIVGNTNKFQLVGSTSMYDNGDVRVIVEYTKTN